MKYYERVKAERDKRAERIRELLARGLSQTEVARRMAVSKQAISAFLKRGRE